MSTSDSALQQNLKILREHHGLTQDDVARFLNINRVVYNGYERGTRTVPLVQLSALADLFGVDEIDLFEENADFQLINSNLNFRKDDLQPNDLAHIAYFQSYIKNFIKMVELKNET